jgi:protein SCO1/2
MRVLALLLAGVLAGCAHDETKTYPIHGQIQAIGGARTDGRAELTLKHDDIPGFMPAMTMPYFVKDPHDVDGLAPGDIVDATLVLKGSQIYLQAIRKAGHAPLPPDARGITIMDVMQAGDEVPDDPLQDQTGATRRLSDWRARALAVTFVYTRCPLPDFCPLMDRHFADLQRAIKDDPRLREKAHLVSVSFDPPHDTPAVIRAHAEARGADPAVWSYLTGTPAAIDHLTSRFGVSAIADKEAAEIFTHNLRTAIVDPGGHLVKIYSGNDWTPADILHDLRVLAR